MDQGEKTEETITQTEPGTRHYSSSGIPSTCRWKAIDPHWKAEPLEAPKPWNWGHSKIKGRVNPCRM